MARVKRKKTGSQIAGEQDRSRWAHLVFALGGFAAAWLLTNFIEDMWAMAWSYWPQYLPRPSTLTANISGIGVALIATVIAWRKERWFKFVVEVIVEFSQVTWPTKAETRAATIVVIVITLISSGILALMDTTWSKVTDLLYGF